MAFLLAATVLIASAMGYPTAIKKRELVRHEVCDPVQIRKNPATGRISKSRGSQEHGDAGNCRGTDSLLLSLGVGGSFRGTILNEPILNY